MEFATVAEYDAPRPQVFAAWRDEMHALRVHLPNVRRLVTLSREEEGATVRLVNEWHAGGDLPAVVRPFVPGDATGWTDHATWDAEAFTCTWRSVSHAFREAVRSEGDHRFEALDDGRSRVTVRGVVDIDPARIPGVPRLLARSLRGAVEQFVVRQVTDNLAAYARAAARHLGVAARVNATPTAATPMPR